MRSTRGFHGELAGMYPDAQEEVILSYHGCVLALLPHLLCPDTFASDDPDTVDALSVCPAAQESRSLTAGRNVVTTR